MSEAYVYSEEKKNVVLEIRNSLVEECEDCGGTGYVPASTEGCVNRCDCMVIFRYLKELVKANIPKDYWALSIEKLEVDEIYKEMVKRYIELLDNAVEKGMGLTFIGANGVGKTSLMQVIGKEAVVRDIPVRYFTLPSYLTAMMEKPKLAEDYSSGKIILLDELDKRYQRQGSKFVSMKLDEIIRDWMNAGKVIILSTNWSASEIKAFSGSLWSLLNRRNEIVKVKGVDFSSRLKNDYWNRLDKSFNYRDKHIVESAFRRENLIQ